MTANHPAFANYALIWTAEKLVAEANTWIFKEDWERFDAAASDANFHYLAAHVSDAVDSGDLTELKHYIG